MWHLTTSDYLYQCAVVLSANKTKRKIFNLWPPQLHTECVLFFQMGREDSILNEWLDCCVTKGGVLVALQKLGKRPLLVKQMVDEWLDHYRQLSHVIPPPPAHQTSLSQNFSSDGESDPEWPHPVVFCFFIYHLSVSVWWTGHCCQW